MILIRRESRLTRESCFPCESESNTIKYQGKVNHDSLISNDSV